MINAHVAEQIQEDEDWRIRFVRVPGRHRPPLTVEPDPSWKPFLDIICKNIEEDVNPPMAVGSGHLGQGGSLQVPREGLGEGQGKG